MQTEPRVKCGEMRAEARPGVSATHSVTNGHTDRSVTCDAEYRQATEWACLPKEQLLLHPVAERFRASVRQARCVEGALLVCYRGRGFAKGDRPSSEEMGPPLEDKSCPEGRYNRKEESVLYLCSSEHAIVREADLEPGHTLYSQRYELPLDQLRIADFTAADLDKFANDVFEIAETFNVGDRGPKNYDFSQSVAALVAEAFDGMMVPGVRGDRSLHYANVVVFRPHPHWRKWLDQEVAPQPHSASVAGIRGQNTDLLVETSTAPPPGFHPLQGEIGIASLERHPERHHPRHGVASSPLTLSS